MAEKKERKPELRFKGFDEEWEERKFGEQVITRRGLTYTPNDIESEGVRVLRSSNIDDDEFILTNDDVFVSKNVINVDYSKENDILITSANGSSRLVGKHALIKNIAENSAVHGGFMLIGTSQDPEFMNASMSSLWYHRFITLHVSGGNGSIGNLKKSDLDNQDIWIPCQNERDRIGDFYQYLSTIISQCKCKYTSLQNLKKAMLEKMFPRDGTDVPEIRFKGFEGAWMPVVLGHSIIESTERTSDFDTYPLYSLTIENGVTPKTQRYERGYLVQKESDLFKIVPLNSFVSNPMNLRFGAIGYNTSKKIVSVSGYYDVFSIDDGLCSDFWNTYLRTPQALKKYEDVATGSLIEKRRVHFGELKKLTFLVPETFEEKKKIGTYFQHLDALITHQQKKLEHLKHLKSALLEKMFVSEKAA